MERSYGVCSRALETFSQEHGASPFEYTINDDFLLNIARRPWIDWMNKVRILIANFSRLDLRLCCFESYTLSLVGG